jgi:hypothetical protein
MGDIENWYNERRYSKITDRNPDPNVFPDFYKARRVEFVLKPGNMVYIPSGMFHFVFSEDPDPETGLCAAINFWYQNSHGEGNDEGDPSDKPMLGWHDLHLQFNEILSVIKAKKTIKVAKSSSGCFPPQFFERFYPYLKETFTTFDEFYKRRNHEEYIAQLPSRELDRYAIKHKTPLKDTTVWINWGNVNTLPHYDGMDNWLCQLKGTRRVILVPQSDRDLLYIFNPYPVELLKKLKNGNFRNNSSVNQGDGEFIHKLNDVMDQNTMEQIIKTLDNSQECIIACEVLERSYEQELNYKEIHSSPTAGHPKWRSFKVKKYFVNDQVPAANHMGILWFLTDACVEINQKCINDIVKGDCISFSPNISAKILKDCVLITPHGFNED